MNKFDILLKCVFLPLSMLIKPNKNIWIFGAWSAEKYGDNPRYLYEYMNECFMGSNIKCFWYTKNKETYKYLSNKNLPVIYGYSFKSILYHLTCGYVFCNCSHATDSLWACINSRANIINLWHGSPIKKIGFDAVGIRSDKLEKQTLFKKLLYIIRKVKLKKIKPKVYYVAPSEFVAGIYKSAFGISDENIIFGMNAKLGPLFEKKRGGSSKILYAPTYRGDYGSEENILENFGFHVESIDKKLTELEKKLTIRLHPANYPSKDILCKVMASDNIRFDDSEDVYELFCQYDVIISDFSSLIFDALALNIPVIIAPFGYEDYLNDDRQLYVSIDELKCGDKIETWDDVVKILDKGINNERYCSLSKMYNAENVKFGMDRLIENIMSIGVLK